MSACLHRVLVISVAACRLEPRVLEEKPYVFHDNGFSTPCGIPTLSLAILDEVCILCAVNIAGI